MLALILVPGIIAIAVVSILAMPWFILVPFVVLAYIYGQG